MTNAVKSRLFVELALKRIESEFKMKKMICTISCFILIVIGVMGLSTKLIWADTKDDSYTIMKDDDYYGTLYGSEYSADDASKWVTLKMGGQGFRIVNQEDKEIMIVDKDGNVYINGDKLNQNQRVPYGFLYLLVVISLLFNVLNFVRRTR